MKYVAKHRFADVAPRKMRPIAQMIRGMNIDEAIEALKFMPNRGARLIEAVVKSAVGNAGDLGCRNIEDLVVTESRIDGAPMFKRIRPRARGTAFGIKRRLAHIIVSLTDLEDLEPKTEATAAPATAAIPAPAATTAPAPAATPNTAS
jgi:large subunit ribosomal protein L22